MSRLLVLSCIRTAIGSRPIHFENLHSAVSLSHLRRLSVSIKFSTKPIDETASKPEKKKTKEIPKITLIQVNDAMSVTTLEEANKLARRRNLELIQIQNFDPKSQRPVYKLTTVGDLLADDTSIENKLEKHTSSASTKKNTFKSLTIGSRIDDHDLSSRLKNISKWLSKSNEVRVLIQGKNNDGNSSELIFQKIESIIKGPPVIGKITQKRVMDKMIKFNIYPMRVDIKESDSNINQPA